MQNSFDFALALPEILLLILAAGVLIFDSFSKSEARHSTFALTQLSLIVVGLVVVWQWCTDMYGVTFSGLYIVDPMSHFLKLLSCIAVAVTLLYGRQYAESRDMVERGGELYSLTMLALLGQLLMISAGNLVMVFLGVELMSFALYALVAIRREHVQSTEAAMKYFILGALSSGVLLYGMSMIYGATGHLDLQQIAAVINAGEAGRLALVFGVVFVVSGLAFKLTAAPFHMWTPDVYQGAPTTVTLIIAAAPKLAAVAVTLRVLIEALHGIALDWQPMLLLLAVLSLVVGNFTALVQTNLKRMLAYSTISHMGFIFLGLMAGVSAEAGAVEGLAGLIRQLIGADVALAHFAYGSALFYAVIYVLTTLATFGIILTLSRKGFECEEISDLKGLNARHPFLALLLLLAMFSLAGIPPLAGFYAKLSILQAVVGVGHIGIAVVAVLLSLVGAFYYLRVVKAAYFDQPESNLLDQPLQIGVAAKTVLAVNGLLILGLGILPGGLMETSMRVIQESLRF